MKNNDYPLLRRPTPIAGVLQGCVTSVSAWYVFRILVEKAYVLYLLVRRTSSKFGTVSAYLGDVFSKEFACKHYLGWSDEEWQNNKALIEKEKQDGAGDGAGGLLQEQALFGHRQVDLALAALFEELGEQVLGVDAQVVAH